jgi:hypothetical protein
MPDMNTFVKVILTGIITTFFRTLGQMLIPVGTQTVLQPSAFVENGTLAVVFVLYGMVAYSILAALFLLIEKGLSGNHVRKGLKYGLSCCAIWIVYLLEPLPHVSPMDKITYPLVDSIALIVMGLLIGLLSKNTPKPEIDTSRQSNTWIDTLIIAACFMNGRIALYFIFDIYSSFRSENLYTILWNVLTGLVMASVALWFEKHLNEQNRVKRALLSGGLLVGVDLFIFNFFMPLVFNADILDLALRTGMDIGCVTIGLLLLPVPIRLRKMKNISLMEIVKL